MTDLAAVAAIALFFVLCGLYVRACAHL